MTLERDRVFSDVRREILSCQLRPGETLSEAELARRFGVSKTPVRDAMQRLEQEGLVEIAPRRGHRVRPVSVQEAGDVIELRAILEAAAVAKVARVATEAELAALDPWRAADTASVQAFADYNRRFHVELACLARNQRLAEEIRRVMDLYDRLVIVSLTSLSRGGGLQGPLADHVALIDALQARNGRLASRLMRQHIARSQAAVIKGLGQQIVVA